MRATGVRVNMTDLCAVDEIDPERGREAWVPGPDGGRWVALFRRGEQVFAYLNVCPHQGRALNLGPNRFAFDGEGRLLCPHHGACFDLATGGCVSGPAGNGALTPVPVRVEGGRVRLADGDGPAA